MTDHREMDQDLVELALGEVAEPRRSELLSHLSGCLRCRAAYSEVVGAVDALVPVAPESQPPAGFDLRVLAAMGIDAPDASRVQRLRYLSRGRSLLAAAAVVLVVAAGLWGASTLRDDTAVPTASGTAVLAKSDGEQVGTAAVAWMNENRVLVMSVNNAPVGVGYRCRVWLANGDSQVLGRWEASSPQGGTWVVPAPQGELSTIQLVTGSGDVWSAARLP